MKHLKYFIPLLLLLMLPAFVITASAHAGKTDANGGHTDHEDGEYHYHHGYPAHDHYDMDGDGIKDCPYDFDDKTGQNSGNSNSTSSDRNNSTSTSPSTIISSQSSTNSTNKTSSDNDKVFDIFSTEYFIFGICASLILTALIFLAIHLDKHSKHTARKITVAICIIIGIADIPFLFVIFQALMLVGIVILLLWWILSPLYHLITKRFCKVKTIKPKHNTALPNKNENINSQKESPGYQLCALIWSRTILFCNKVTANSSLKCQVYTWTVFFYGITKTIRRQEIIDDIYKHFLPSSAPFVSYCLLNNTSECTQVEANLQIQRYYHQMRAILQDSQIDPRDNTGIYQLWNLILSCIFTDCPLSDDCLQEFVSSLELLIKRADILYKTSLPPQAAYLLEDTTL